MTGLVVSGSEEKTIVDDLDRKRKLLQQEQPLPAGRTTFIAVQNVKLQRINAAVYVNLLKHRAVACIESEWHCIIALVWSCFAQAQNAVCQGTL